VEQNEQVTPEPIVHKSRKKRVLFFVVPVSLVLSIPSFLIYGPSLVAVPAVRESLVSLVNRSIPGSIAIGSVKLSLPRGELEIADFACFTKDGESVFKAKLFRVYLVPRELFDKKVHITELRLTNPTVSLEQNADGMFNIVSVFVDSLAPADTTKPKQPYPPQLPVKIVIDTVIVDSLQMRFDQKSSGMLVSIDNGSIQGKAELFPLRVKIATDIDRFLYRNGDSTSSFYADLLELSTVATDQVLDSIRATVVTPRDTLRCRGLVRDFLTDSLSFGLNLDGALSLGFIRDISGADIGDGRFLMNVRGDGTPGNPSVSGYLGYRGNSLAGTGISFIDLPVNLRDRIVSTKRGTVTRNDGTTLTAAVSVGLQGLFPLGFTKPMADLNTIWYRGKGNAYAPKIPETDLPLRENRAEFSIDGKGTSPEQLDLKLSLDYRCIGQQSGERVPLQLTGDVAMKNQIVTISRSMLSLENRSSVKAAGSVNLKKESLDLAVNIAPTRLTAVQSLVKGGFPAEGIVYGSVAMRGSYTAPELEYRLFGSDLTVVKKPLGTVALQGTVSPRHGTVKTTGSVRGDCGLFELDLFCTLFKKGTFSLLRTPQFALEARADSLDLAILADSVVGGTASAIVSYNGSVGAGSGSLELRIDSLSNRQFALPQITSSVQIHDSLVTVSSLELGSDSSKIRASGTYHLDGTYDFVVDSDTLEPRLWVPSIPADPRLLLLVQGAAKGNRFNPSADLIFTVPDFKWNDISLGTQTVRAGLKNNRVDFSAEGLAMVNGFYDLKSTFYQANGSVKQFVLDPYFAAFGQKGLSGLIDGVFSLEGTAKGIDTAIVKLPFVAIKSDTSALVDGKNVAFSFGKNGLLLDTVNVRLMDRGDALVTGTVSMDQLLDIAFDVEMPLAIVEEFTPAIEHSSGMISLVGTVNGSVKYPEIQGVVQFDSLSMLLTDLQQKLHSLSGKVTIKQNLFRVDSVSGIIDDGSFSADGVINLVNNKPVSGDFSAKLFNLPLNIPEIADLRLGGDLRFSADSAKQGITGAIDLLECYYYQYINALPKIDISSKRAPISSDKKPSPLDNTDLSIRIIPRKNIFVDNNLAQFDIRPELTIGGTASNPLLEGRMDVLSGELNYLNRKFTVTSGTIEFVNPDKIEPEVDIIAETVINTWKIGLTIKGIVGKELFYKMESTPPLLDNEIVALILTGKPTFTEGVAFDLNEFLMKQLSSKTKERFGLDMELDLKTGKFKIGEQLNRRVYTNYSIVQENMEIKQVAEVLIKLFDLINIRGFAGSEGTAGGEVQLNAKIR